MNKCELFEQYIYDICGKTRTKIPKITKGRLRDYAAWCNGCNRIAYNSAMIADCNNKELVNISAHEVGHIRSNGITREEREYKAELFSLKTVYNHYKDLFTLYYSKVSSHDYNREYGRPFKAAIRDFKKWRKKC